MFQVRNLALLVVLGLALVGCGSAGVSMHTNPYAGTFTGTLWLDNPTRAGGPGLDLVHVTVAEDGTIGGNQTFDGNGGYLHGTLKADGTLTCEASFADHSPSFFISGSVHWLMRDGKVAPITRAGGPSKTINGQVTAIRYPDNQTIIYPTCVWDMWPE